MDALKPWLRATALKLLSTVIGRRADGESHNGLGDQLVFLEEGNVRLGIDESNVPSNVVQIVEVGHVYNWTAFTLLPYDLSHDRAKLTHKHRA